MKAATELVQDLLAALEEVPGLHPATLVKARQTWGWNWDTLAVDVTDEAGGGHTVVVRVVATQLPLAPLVRRAEEALLAASAASHLPITRLCLEITDIDSAAFA